jgi:hypothetical protein
VKAKTIMLAGTLVLAALAVAQSSPGRGDAAPTFQKRILTLHEQESKARVSFVDNAPRTTTDPKTGEPRHFSAGDLFTATKPVLDTAKRAAGSIEEYCVITTEAKTPDRSIAVCTALIRLKDGILTAALSPDFTDATPRVVAITGGTGAYAGATGELVPQGGGTTQITLFIPVG